MKVEEALMRLRVWRSAFQKGINHPEDESEEDVLKYKAICEALRKEWV